MFRDRLSLYRARVRRELTAAFEERHTPHEVAASFAIGIFVTAMPTGGLGIGLFFLLAYWWSWVSKTAMFASVVVLNPIVKPAVYVVSYQLGAALVGSEPLFLVGRPLVDSALTVVQLLLVGNLLVALALAAIGYVTVLQLTRSYRRHATRRPESSLSLTVSLLQWRRK
ncbi:DUF2062 domain-containing protein [Natrononativus amylolyticus]|uniref:DUF2062 domain-containing protein n=1 Tax=Natrononativus amylolyticus TaxID=2963434 RepID=UPI0020CE7309|nr:DUF2062 domain-containing protein [Natrononativus amylolyticus]